MIQQLLKERGIILPPPTPPAFDYVPVVIHGGLAWVSGQLPRDAEGKLPILGRLGDDVDVDQGRKAAELCVLQGLAVLNQALGSLDLVERLVKITGFVASAPGFIEQPKVIDAASNILGSIFGAAGKHARSAVGVAMLPRNVPVEIEFVFAVKDGR